jgi:hypothetical protein
MYAALGTAFTEFVELFFLRAVFSSKDDLYPGLSSFGNTICVSSITFSFLFDFFGLLARLYLVGLHLPELTGVFLLGLGLLTY